MQRSVAVLRQRLAIQHEHDSNSSSASAAAKDGSIHHVSGEHGSFPRHRNSHHHATTPAITSMPSHHQHTAISAPADATLGTAPWWSRGREGGRGERLRFTEYTRGWPASGTHNDDRSLDNAEGDGSIPAQGIPDNCWERVADAMIEFLGNTTLWERCQDRWAHVRFRANEYTRAMQFERGQSLRIKGATAAAAILGTQHEGGGEEEGGDDDLVAKAAAQQRERKAAKEKLAADIEAFREDSVAMFRSMEHAVQHANKLAEQENMRRKGSAESPGLSTHRPPSVGADSPAASNGVVYGSNDSASQSHAGGDAVQISTSLVARSQQQQQHQQRNNGSFPRRGSTSRQSFPPHRHGTKSMKEVSVQTDDEEEVARDPLYQPARRRSIAYEQGMVDLYSEGAKKRREAETAFVVKMAVADAEARLKKEWEKA